MKIIKILSVLFLSLLVLPGCDESESLVTGVEGGFIELKDPSINYIVGNNGPYSCSFRIYQGTVKTVKIEVLKSFHTMVPAPTLDDSLATELASSDEVLFKTFDITDLNQNSIESFDFNFSELVADLTIEDNLLPTMMASIKSATIGNLGIFLRKMTVRLFNKKGLLQ